MTAIKRIVPAAAIPGGEIAVEFEHSARRSRRRAC